ncbi:uncharacterized protein LOC118197442, partial [Stegodyphus dumicola]|uniref:uncharacterized protein LOC118197442 n=1 Tax=Stegodyphus dumicola TaxID=202533 RepID=UPI0015B0161B
MKEDQYATTQELSKELNISAMSISRAAAQVVSVCKDILYSTIELLRDEIRNVNLELEQLKRCEEHEPKKSTKKVSELFEKQGRFTSKQLLLLNALEEEILKTEITKNQEIIELCVNIYVTAIEKKEEKVQAMRLHLEKLGKAERSLVFEASKIIFDLRNICNAILNQEKVEIDFNQKKLGNIQEVKSISQNEGMKIFRKIEAVFTEAFMFQKDSVEFMMLNLKTLEDKEQQLKSEISHIVVYCKDLLLIVMQIIETDIKHALEDLKSLTACGFVEVNKLDESLLSEEEKYAVVCNNLLTTGIEDKKSLIDSITLEIQFLRGNIKEPENDISNNFPSWYERFLMFMDMKLDEFACESSSDTFFNDCEESEESSFYDEEPVFHFSKKVYCIELLKSLEHKKLKQPVYAITSWNELFLRALLMHTIEYEEKKSTEIIWDPKADEALCQKTGSESVQYRSKIICTENLDELLLSSIHLLKEENKVASQLRKRKQETLSLVTWTEIFMNSIQSWNVMMRKEFSLIQYKNMLLNWKGKVGPKEFSGSLAGYQNDNAASVELNRNLEFFLGSNFADKKTKYQNKQTFHPDSELSSKPSGKRDCDQESSDRKHETYRVSQSWEDILYNVYHALMEGNRLRAVLNRKDGKIQRKVAKFHSTLDNFFLNAIKAQKDDLEKNIRKNNILKELAKRINERLKSGFQEIVLQKKVKFSSLTWAQPIFEVFQKHQKELTNALRIKKREMEKSVKPPPIETYSEEKILKTESEELISEVKKLLTKVVELQRNEIQVMEQELNADKNVSHPLTEFNNSLQPVVLWKKIVASAANLKKTGIKFEMKSKKSAFSKSTEDLFFNAKLFKMKELNNGKCSEEKSKKKILSEIVPASGLCWSKIFDTVNELTEKELIRMDKLGVKIKNYDGVPFMNEEQRSSDMETDDSTHWTDLFLRALEQKENEISSDKLKLFKSVEQNSVRSQPSWDEIFFVMSQQNKGEIQERLFNHTNGATKSHRDILCNIQKMVSSNFFSWYDVLLVVVKEVLKEIEEESLLKKSEGNPSKMKCNSTLYHLEKSVEKAIKNEHAAAAKNEPCFLKGFKVKSWIDLLPSQDGAKKLLMEETWNRRKEDQLLDSVVNERKKDHKDSMWKDVFPLAVEVWKKQIGHYLNVEEVSCIKSEENEISFFENNDIVNFQNKMLIERNKKNMFEKELNAQTKRLMQERFDFYDPSIERLSQDSVLSIVKQDSSNQKNVWSHNKQLMQQTKNRNLYGSAKDLDPQYFLEPVSWQEIFLAAVEINKEILCDLIELEYQDFQKTAEVQSEDASFHYKQHIHRKLEYRAASVLDLPITLQDLLDGVANLKKKNLIIYKELDNTENNVSESENFSKNESLKASDIIKKFKCILASVFVSRKHGAYLLDNENGKLKDIQEDNLKNLRISVILNTLKQYCENGVKCRQKENKLIDYELNKLGDLKCIFSGYLECGMDISLQQKNKKRIKLLDQMLYKIALLQNEFHAKLVKYINYCIGVYETAVQRRKDEMQYTDLSAIDVSGKKFEMKYLELLSRIKEVLLSAVNLGKPEIQNMMTEIQKWKITDNLTESIENKVIHIFDAVEKFYNDGISVRKQLLKQLAEEKQLIDYEDENLKIMVSNLFIRCKNLCELAVQCRKNETNSLKDKTEILKRSFEWNDHVKLSAIIANCENLVERAVDRRTKEIQSLSSFLNEIEGNQPTQVHSACKQYFLSAIEKRKIEINDIELVLEPLEEIDTDVSTELSFAIDDALSDVLAEGMVFLNTRVERRQSEDAQINAEAIAMCTEFYRTAWENVENEITVMKENLNILVSFEGDVIEQ